MAFGYYNRLTRRQQDVYRRSDAIETVPLPDRDAVILLGRQLAEALAAENPRETSRISAVLIAEICTGLNAPQIRVKVMDKRPSDDSEELHGYYEPLTEKRLAEITVWMRTAKKNKVVAFKTFLRTLLHELCHHLDYEHYSFEESFHTQGFFKRESSLFHQIVPD